MKLSRRNKILLVFALLLNFVAAFAYFRVFGAVREGNRNFAKISAEIELESGRAEESAALLTMLDSIAPERARLDSHFITQNELVQFFNHIEKLGLDSQVNLEIVSVGSPGSVLITDLKATGSFKGVVKLSLLLENMPYEFNFEKVHLSKTELEEGPGWQGNFTINLVSFLPS